MIVNRQTIKRWDGVIIGFIETDEKGNKTVKDFHGHILGKYDKKHDVTRDFYGRQVAKGDQSPMLFSFSQQ